MQDELSQRELNQIVFGAPPVVVAEFYDEDVLDVSASREANERRLMKKVYIHQTCEKEKSEGRRPMQEADKHRHPKAWAKYAKRKEDESRTIQNIQSERSIGGSIAKAQKG